MECAVKNGVESKCDEVSTSLAARMALSAGWVSWARGVDPEIRWSMEQALVGRRGDGATAGVGVPGVPSIAKMLILASDPGFSLSLGPWRLCACPRQDQVSISVSS